MKYIKYFENINFDDDENWDEIQEDVIPDKWCIKITTENKNIIQKFRWGWPIGYDYTIGGYYWKSGADYSPHGEIIDLNTFLKIIKTKG